MADTGSSDDGSLRNIVADYCLLADAKRYREFAGLFADAGRIFIKDALQAEGPGAVHDWLAGRPMPDGHHLTSNVRIEVDGDQASGRSYFVFLSAENTVTFFGVYTMRFVRASDDWRILEWRID